MRREASGLRPVHLVFVVLLLVPPGIRIGLRLQNVKPESESATASELEAELVALRRRVDQLESELGLQPPL